MFLFFPAVGIPSVVAQDEAEMPFVMAYGSDIGELNPLVWRSERSHWYDMLVYDSLLSYDDDLGIIPWLAEDYAVSTDGLTVNFTIREGATWHDGEDLTAGDVAFTFEYVRDAPADVNYWTMLQNLTSATDDAPADDARWNDATNVTAHVGSGPFMYVQRVPDEYTTLARFDAWWGPDNPLVGQIPNIDEVRIDVVNEVFGAYVDEILGYDELQLVQGVASQWDYVLGMNNTIPGLDDLVVRQAIGLAIDREELITIGRLGHGTATTSAIPDIFYPGLFDESGVFDENVTLANEMLDDAGYLDNDADGTRNFPGQMNLSSI